MPVLHPHQQEKPSGSVRLINTEDGAALLDVRQNLCLGMTPTGAEIWGLLVQGHSADQIVDGICARFSVSYEQVYEDVQQFLINLREKGLLETTSTRSEREPNWVLWLLRIWGKRLGARSTAPGRFLFWRALVGLFAFDLLRFGQKFYLMHEFVKLWPVRICLSDPLLLDRASSALNHACVWYPKRVLCLQRSAVFTCLLRDCGVSAQMVMGAQKFPFKAHAWTEVNGHAINERRDVASIYQVWERC